MSLFKVEIVRLNEVVKHPGADRLDLCKIRGWQCVSVKGQFVTGDLAIYIPIDSVLPEALVTLLGIEKMYHKRIRSIKLRGYVSQGMVIPLKTLDDLGISRPDGPPKEGDDVTELLGIVKWEEPIPICMAGKVRGADPRFQKYTDIENYKNFPDVFQPGEMVAVTEKCHGTNGRAMMLDGELHVGSHRLDLMEEPGNLYWRAAALLNLKEKLKEGEGVFFEVYGSGVQDLNYGKKQGEIAVGVFDVIKDNVYLDYAEFMQFCIERGWVDYVLPVVTQGEWNSSFTKEASGNSLIAPNQIREGVVIKPMKERFSEPLQGRCIIKCISDDYLIRKDAKEGH